jgi:hypothetical protein
VSRRALQTADQHHIIQVQIEEIRINNEHSIAPDIARVPFSLATEKRPTLVFFSQIFFSHGKNSFSFAFEKQICSLLEDVCKKNT